MVQPIVDVSPPKWHLGHTTWFFEEFILKNCVEDYTVSDPEYSYIFNSYYESMGKRVVRADRGNLSRPSVSKGTCRRAAYTYAIFGRQGLF